MSKVEIIALKKIGGVRPGEQFLASKSEANLLVKLKKAQYAPQYVPQAPADPGQQIPPVATVTLAQKTVSATPAETAPKKREPRKSAAATDSAPKKRTYQRRDLTAEK